MGNHEINAGFVSTPEVDKFAPTTWGKPVASNEPYEFRTGSGQLCLIRKLGMDDILRLGMLDKVDFFAKSMAEDDEADKPKPTKKELAKHVLGNFDNMDETINAFICVGVIAPQVLPVPEHAALRREGVVYVDTIPFTDRVTLFSEIMDSEGLSTFREESEDGMGIVSDEQVSADSP